MSNDTRMPLLKSASRAPFSGGHHDDDADHHHDRPRTGILKSLPVRTKNHIVAALAEFIGTFLFLFFAFAGAHVANNTAAPGGGDSVARLLFIALSFGLSLAVNVWVFFRVCGGQFNPVVSLAMVLTGAMGFLRAALVVPAQLLGGIAAAAMVSWLLPGPLAVNTALGGGMSVGRGLVLEMFLTAELILTIFMLAGEKHRGTFLAPLGIGLSLFITHLAGVYYTGASLNPARSFGPAVVTGHFVGEHWIYWLGPILGSLLASLVYWLIKAVDYTTVNPGQDAAADAAGGDDYDNDSKRRTATTDTAAHQASSSGVDGGHGTNGSGGATAAKDMPYERSPRLEDGEGSRAPQ
ncbi:hypothetical protein G7054_g6064 [Neopestalotiopsis clavispora]|nr:hypothetical protein G7054_g6064 [Neopestalotiopsis clavispora]